MSEEVIKAYKGFNKNMTCRGFQFEEDKEYETDGAEVCEKGFHACEMPLDVFNYYPPATSVYHEVEQSGEISKADDDTKVASSKIKIGAALSIANLCKLHFELVKAKSTSEGVAGDRGAATAGDRGAATAGDRGAATAGDRGAATAGNCGAATAGNCGAATAGYGGAATAGNRGAATSRGKASGGANCIISVRGNGVKAKGGIGSVIVIANENENNYDLKEWKAGVVDGKTLKADTWYKLENGEFVEADEEGEQK